MSGRARLFLLLVPLAAFSLPLVTAHALLPALVTHERESTAEALHPEITLLAILTALSMVPMLGMVLGGIRWAHARLALRRLTQNARRARHVDVDYRSIPGDQVTLFTAGVWRPTIYASVGAERTLSDEAFVAALLHEQAHLRQRDPFWMAVIALAEASVGWLPSARRSFAELRTQLEWRADQGALRAGAARIGLFDAIVGAAAVTQWVAPLTGAGATQRLRWLAEPDLQPAEEPAIGVALTGLLVPPAAAHVLVWTGLICALCAQHLR